MTTPHITELRQSLMDTLKHLGTLGRDGKPLDPEQIKAQVSVANAMKGVADTLVDTAKVEVEYLKATGQDRSGFLEEPPDSAVAHLGHTTTGVVSALPAPGNGITSVTQHRMRG